MFSDPGQWTSDKLQPLRSVGDPLADDVVTELFADGGIASMNDLMRHFVANEYPVPASLPRVVQDYLEQSRDLPPWVDPAKIKAGEDVFWRFGPQLILVLTCYGLPFCYLGTNGAPVLAMTNRLVSNPTRRIVETAQLVVDVMRPGGLTSQGGRGRLTIQKVRLMHAAVRRLAPMAPGWKAEFGLPVNQEDLAGTLMSFSWISLDGLEKLGVELSDDDREAYIHCWNVVGHQLGLRDELIPANVACAKGLADAISAHEFGPSAAGQELTSALMKMIAHILPGNAFDKVPQALAHHFLGEKASGWLGLQPFPMAEVVAAPLRIAGVLFGEAVADSVAIRHVATQTGKLLIGAILLVERGGKRPSFAIPADLKQQWGVNWTS
ncbi:MAG: oxygenase MpaB family protein [Terriglobia bacterium]